MRSQSWTRLSMHVCGINIIWHQNIFGLYIYIFDLEAKFITFFFRILEEEGLTKLVLVGIRRRKQ